MPTSDLLTSTLLVSSPDIFFQFFPLSVASKYMDFKKLFWKPRPLLFDCVVGVLHWTMWEIVLLKCSWNQGFGAEFQREALPTLCLSVVSSLCRRTIPYMPLLIIKAWFSRTSTSNFLHIWVAAEGHHFHLWFDFPTSTIRCTCEKRFSWRWPSTYHIAIINI